MSVVVFADGWCCAPSPTVDCSAGGCELGETVPAALAEGVEGHIDYSAAKGDSGGVSDHYAMVVCGAAPIFGDAVWVVGLKAIGSAATYFTGKRADHGSQFRVQGAAGL